MIDKKLEEKGNKDRIPVVNSFSSWDGLLIRFVDELDVIDIERSTTHLVLLDIFVLPDVSSINGTTLGRQMGNS